MTETPGEGAQIGGAYFGLGFDFTQFERDLDRAEALARARVAQIQAQINQISKATNQTVNTSSRVAAPRPINVRQQVIVTRVTRVVEAAPPPPPKTPGQERQSQEVVVQRRYTVISRLLAAPPRIPAVRQTQDIQVTRTAHVVRDSQIAAPRKPPTVEQVQQVDVKRSTRITEAPAPPAPKQPSRVEQVQQVDVEREAHVSEAQLPSVKQPTAVRQQQQVYITRVAHVTEAGQLPPPPDQPDITQTQNVFVHRQYHLERGEVPHFAAPVPERLEQTQDVVVHRETRLAQETVNLPTPPSPPPISEHQELTVRRTAHIEGPPPLSAPAAPAPVQQTQQIKVTRHETATTQAAPAPEPPATVQQTQDIVVHRETHFEERAQEQLPPAATPAPIHQTQQIDVRRQQRVTPPPALEPPQQPVTVKQTQDITVERQIHATGGQLLKPAEPPRVHQTQEIDVERETHLIGESAISLPAPDPLQPIHETQQVTVQREVSLDQRAQSLDLPPPVAPAPVQQTQDVDVRRQTHVEPTPPVKPPAPQPRVSQTQEIRVERRPHAVDEPLSAPAEPPAVRQQQEITVTRAKHVREQPLPEPIAEAPVQQTQEITVDRERHVGRTSPVPQPPAPPPDVRQEQKITIDRKTVVRTEPVPSAPQAPVQVTQRQVQEITPQRQARAGSAGAPNVAVIRAEFDRLVRPVIEQAVRHFGGPEHEAQLPEIVAEELEREFERFTATSTQHVAQAPSRQVAITRVADSLRNLPGTIRQQLGGLPEPAGAPRASADLERIVRHAIFGVPDAQVTRSQGTTSQRVLVVAQQQATPVTTPAAQARTTSEPREPSPSRVFNRPSRTYAYARRGDDQQLTVGPNGASVSTFLGPNVPPEVVEITRAQAAARLRFQRNTARGFDRLPRSQQRALRGTTEPGRVRGPEEVLPRSIPETVVQPTGPRPETEHPAASTITQPTPVVFNQPPAVAPRQQPLPPAPHVIAPPAPAVVRRTPLPPAPQPFTPRAGQRVFGLSRALGPTRGVTASEASLREQQAPQPRPGFTTARIGDDAPFQEVPTRQLFRSLEDAQNYAARRDELERRAQATGRRQREFQYERLGQQVTLQTGLTPSLQREGRLPQQLTRSEAAQILASNRARIRDTRAPAAVAEQPQRPALNAREFAEATHVISLENQGRPGRQYFVPPGRLDEALQQVLPKLTGSTVANLQVRDPRTEVLSKDIQLTRADVEQRLSSSQAPATQQQPISVRSAVEISRDIDRLTRSIRRQVDQVTRQRQVAQSPPAIAAAQAATVRLAESRTRLQELEDELRAATTNTNAQQTPGIPPGVARLRAIEGRATGDAQQQPDNTPPGFFALHLPSGETILLPTGNQQAAPADTTAEPAAVVPKAKKPRQPRPPKPAAPPQQTAVEPAAAPTAEPTPAAPAAPQQPIAVGDTVSWVTSRGGLQFSSRVLDVATGKHGTIVKVQHPTNPGASVTKRLEQLTRVPDKPAVIQSEGAGGPDEEPQLEPSLEDLLARAQQRLSTMREKYPEITDEQAARSLPALDADDLLARIQQRDAVTPGGIIAPESRGAVRTGDEVRARINEATRPRTLQELGLASSGPQVGAPQQLILPSRPAGPGAPLILPANSQPVPQPAPSPVATPVAAPAATQVASIPVPPVSAPSGRKQTGANNLFQQLVAAGMPVADAAAQVQAFFGVAPSVPGAPPPVPTPTPAAGPTRTQNRAAQQVQQRLAIATGAPFSSTLTGRLIAPPGFQVPPQFQGQFVRPGGALGAPLTAAGVPPPPPAPPRRPRLPQQPAILGSGGGGTGGTVGGGAGGGGGGGAGGAPVLQQLGIGAINPARIALGLAGIPVGLNVLAGLARQVHDAAVGIVHDTDSLVQSFREIGIAYGELGQRQIATGFAQFNDDPNVRGTVEQYTRSAAALRNLSQQYGFSTQQITGVISAAGQLSRIYGTDLPTASGLLERALQGDGASAQQLGLNLTDNQGRLRSVGVSFEDLASIVGRARAAQILYNDVQAEVQRQADAAAAASDKTADSIDRIGKAADRAKSFLTNLVSAPYRVIVEAVANIVGGIQQSTDTSQTQHPIGQPVNQQLADLQTQRKVTHVGDIQQTPRFGGQLPGAAAYIAATGQLVGVPVSGLNPNTTNQQLVNTANSPLVAVGAIGAAGSQSSTIASTPTVAQLVAPGQQSTDSNRRPIPRVLAPGTAQSTGSSQLLPSSPPSFGANVAAGAQQLVNPGTPPPQQPPSDPNKLNFSGAAGAAAAAGIAAPLLNAQAAATNKVTDATNKLITSTERLAIANKQLIGTAETIGSITERQARAQQAGSLAQTAEGPEFPLRTLSPEQASVIAEQRASQATFTSQAAQRARGAADEARSGLQAAATTRNPEAQAALQDHNNRVAAERQIIDAQHVQAVTQNQTAQAQARVDVINTQNEQQRLAAQLQVNDLTQAQLELQGSLAPLLLEEANIRDQITLATRENLDLTERTLRAQQSAIPSSRALETANFTEQQATQRAVVAAVDRIQGRAPSFDINEQIQTIKDIEFKKPQLELNAGDAQRQVQLAQEAQSDFQLGQQIGVIPQQRREQDIQGKEIPLSAASREVQAQADALSRALQAAELSRAPALIEAQSEMLNARLEEIHATLKLSQSQASAAGLTITNNLTVPGNLNLSQDYVDRLSSTLTAATIQALIAGRETSGQRVQPTVPGGRP